MANLRTEITEITTGLAMLGYQDLQRALEVRPRHIAHVDDEVFDRLEAAHASGVHVDEFDTAWGNGLAFARSPLGLRGRPPWDLEWKGPHKPASKSIETIPADLRIDHVYLISCKYGSRILHNAGPSTLFDHSLTAMGPTDRVDWFEEVAPEAFRAVWAPVFERAEVDALAPSASNRAQRQRVKRALADDPIDTDAAPYRAFVTEVSQRSAARWRAGLSGTAAHHELYWRLLRMQAAPYFLLGARHDGTPLRYRIETPWDFRRRYFVDDIVITPGSRGQPSVDWHAEVLDISSGETVSVAGHVEVRWSHGKLNGAPEAKVYLDTDPLSVPGYDAL